MTHSPDLPSPASRPAFARGRREITVWMNMPSPYQGDFFRELAGREDVDLNVIFAEQLDPERTKMGWTESGAGYRAMFLRSPRSIGEALTLAWRQRHRVHIVNGIWAIPAFVAAAALLMFVDGQVFFHAETSDPRVPRGGWRQRVRNLIGRVLLPNARGMLAISTLAERFYLERGARPATLFPYAYFKRHRFEDRPVHADTEKEILFVGLLIERKGVEPLLRAFASCATDYPDAVLTYVGVGPLEARLRAVAVELGVAGRVRLPGAVASSGIDDRIRQAAMLVLPSQFDGWGLVVNEALAGGVPVVVSDTCGAADLIRSPRDGRVFPSGDVPALARCLGEVLAQATQRPEPTLWAGRISIAVAVDYTLACLAYGLGELAAKPLAPWRAIPHEAGPKSMAA